MKNHGWMTRFNNETKISTRHLIRRNLYLAVTLIACSLLVLSGQQVHPTFSQGVPTNTSLPPCPSPTNTRTPSNTPNVIVPTNTFIPIPTNTFLPTPPCAMSTPVPSATATLTASFTASSTLPNCPTLTPTRTPSNTVTPGGPTGAPTFQPPTNTSQPIPPCQTVTATPFLTATFSNTPTDTLTPSSTDTASPTPSATNTATDTATATNTATATFTPSDTATPTLTYTPGPVASVDMLLTPDTAAADGQDPITIKIVARDAFGQAKPGATVTLSSTNADFAFEHSTGLTDNNGTFYGYVRSTKIGIGNVNVNVDGVTETRIARFAAGDVTLTIDGLSSVLAGQNVIYAIHAKNQGLMPARNVVVRAGLPIGKVTFESETHPQTGNPDTDVQLLSQVGNQLTWVIPQLAKDQVVTVLLVGRTANNLSIQPGQNVIQFGAQVSSLPDANLSNNESIFPTLVVAAQQPTSVIQPQKFSLLFDALPTTATVGQTIALQLHVTNTSNEVLYNVEGFSDLRALTKTLIFTWPNPAFAGRLLPGESAVASFPYTIPANFVDLSQTPPMAWAKAVDSDPGDGQSPVSNTVALSNLTVNGPGVTVSVAADKTAAVVGEAVHFTVTINNDSHRNDSAQVTSVTDTLTGQTYTLTNPIAPGQSGTITFDYMPTALDVPQIVSWVTVSGQGVNTPNATFSVNARTTVSVVQPASTATIDPNATASPTPDTRINLSINTSALDENKTLAPSTPRSIGLFLAKSGTQAAQNVTLRMTLPPDVTITDLGTAGDNRSYDAATHRATWTWSSLSSGQNVTPMIQANAPVGSVVTFDLAVITDTEESNLTDNAVSINLTVVERTPSNSTLQIVGGRTFLVGDGKDSLTLRLNTLDQFGVPMSNVNAVLSADVSGVIFTPATLSTDGNGVATFTVKATGSGQFNVTARLDGGAVVTTTNPINLRPSAIVPDKTSLEIGVGGTDAYTLAVTNTNATGTNDVYTFAVTSLDGLDPAWLHFEPATLPLAFGRTDTSRLVVSIPDGQCQAARDYNLQVTATGSDSNVLGQTNLTLSVKPTAPTLRAVLPQDSQRAGSTNVLFSWRSNTAGESKLFVRKHGETNYVQYPMSANAQDTTLYLVSLSLTNGSYEWYGTTTTTCGPTSTGSETAPHHFDVTQSISFIDRTYSFTVGDDYNLQVDVNNQPLAVRVRNDDTVAHTVTLNVDTPYTDLILGFVGSGSVNQAAVLQPGEIRSFTLRVFTQQIQQTQYGMTLSLKTDNATDSVPLTIVVQRPVPAFQFTALSTDPNTLITTARLTNLGKTVTDFDFDVLDPTTGIPANFAVEPDLHHVYIPAGTSVDFQLIPLELSGTEAAFTPNSSDPLPVSYVPQKQLQQVSFTASLFNVKWCAAETCRTVSNAINNLCPAGQQIFTYKDAEPLQFSASSSAWYCTNTPNIDVALRLPVSFSFDTEILESIVKADFTPGTLGEQTISHNVDLSFNNILLGGVIVPDVGTATFSVPASAWLGGTLQTLNLRSAYPQGNQAHFTRNANNRVSAIMQNTTSRFCAATQTEADALHEQYLYLHRLQTKPPTLTVGQSLWVQCNYSQTQQNIKLKLRSSPQLKPDNEIGQLDDGTEVIVADSNLVHDPVNNGVIDWIDWLQISSPNNGSGYIAYEIKFTQDSQTKVSLRITDCVCRFNVRSAVDTYNTPEDAVAKVVTSVGKLTPVPTDKPYIALERYENDPNIISVKPTTDNEPTIWIDSSKDIDPVPQGNNACNYLKTRTPPTPTPTPIPPTPTPFPYPAHHAKEVRNRSGGIRQLRIDKSISTLCPNEPLWKQDICNVGVDNLDDDEYVKLTSLWNTPIQRWQSNKITNDTILIKDMNFSELDLFWLQTFNRGVMDIPPWFGPGSWENFVPSSCDQADLFCQHHGQGVVDYAVDFYYDMYRIGIDIHSADGAGQQWAINEAVILPSPGVSIVPDVISGKEPYSQEVGKYACAKSALGPLSGQYAAVCWVCTDVVTQIWMREGVQIQPIRDFYTDTRNGLYKPSTDTALNKQLINSSGRSVNTWQRYFSDKLQTFYPGSQFPYDVGEMTFLRTDRDGYYHSAIVVKGGSTLNDVLVAQVSYTSAGFWQITSDEVLGFNLIDGDANGYGLHPYIGRYQVVTLRTWLLRAMARDFENNKRVVSDAELSAGPSNALVDHYLGHGRLK